MSKIKIGDVLKPFNGEGDVASWLDKVDLVAQLQDVADVASLIPLMLEGDAFAVYQEMAQDEKKSVAKIKTRLKEAFAENPFTAYEILKKKIWSGESVDVFVTELRRLTRLAGLDSEIAVKRAFVTGLPAIVSRELRALPNIETMPMTKVIARARALMAEEKDNFVAVSASRTQNRQGRNNTDGRNPRIDTIKCYRCLGPHLMRDCTATTVVCKKCHKTGHVFKDCNQGNGQGGDGVLAATPPSQ